MGRYGEATYPTCHVAAGLVNTVPSSTQIANALRRTVNRIRAVARLIPCPPRRGASKKRMHSVSVTSPGVVAPAADAKRTNESSTCRYRALRARSAGSEIEPRPSTAGCSDDHRGRSTHA